jgi:phenylpropionate dioxygenase-like ring-hydroxylating dioxygenase large terminal subunit
MPRNRPQTAPAETRDLHSVARVPNGWYAACRSDDVGETPIARTLLGNPIALYRDQKGRAAALLDRCSHRNVPLSLGTVDEDGLLACPYHGWRFDHGGACRLVPGLLDGSDASGRSVPAFATREQDGFVWAWGEPDTDPIGDPVRIPYTDHPDYFVVVREYDVECTLHAALENALDVPHTAFIHRGDFRGKTSNEIEAVRRRIPGGIEVEYVGEPPFSGEAVDDAGNRVLQEHWDRFFMPGVAQVEYKTGHERHTGSTLPHTPVDDFHTRFWLVSCWKHPAPREHMQPRVEQQLDTILAQDVEILRAQTRQIERFGGESYRSTELDLMGPEILRMLRQAERGLDTDSADISRSVKLRVF